MTNLRNLRLQKGLTQPQLCEKFDMPLRTYQDYESGKIEMKYSVLHNFSNFFGCSIDYLLGHKTEDLTANCTPLQKKLIHHILELDQDLCEIAEATIEGLYVTNQERKLLRNKVAKISSEGDVQNGI